MNFTFNFWGWSDQYIYINNAISGFSSRATGKPLLGTRLDIYWNTEMSGSLGRNKHFFFRQLKFVNFYRSISYPGIILPDWKID